MPTEHHGKEEDIFRDLQRIYLHKTKDAGVINEHTHARQAVDLQAKEPT